MDRKEYIAQLTNGIPDHADPALRKYWLVTRVLGTGLALLFLELPLIIIAFLALSEGAAALFILVLAVFVLLLVVIPMAFYAIYSYLEYENYTFNIEKTHVTINRGILFRHSLTVPYGRVQGVAIAKGPLMRLFRIATVNVTTAGYMGILGPTIQGVGEPEIVRDVILQRVRELRLNSASTALDDGL